MNNLIKGSDGDRDVQAYLNSRGYSGRSCAEDILLKLLDNGTELSPSQQRHHDKLCVSGRPDLQGLQWVFVAAGVLFIGISLLTTTWLKILIAPKLYLLEYAAALIK